MPKQKLVVIGNGMAGARAVEEVLSRGGAELFDIVMFGIGHLQVWGEGTPIDGVRTLSS